MVSWNYFVFSINCLLLHNCKNIYSRNMTVYPRSTVSSHVKSSRLYDRRTKYNLEKKCVELYITRNPASLNINRVSTLDREKTSFNMQCSKLAQSLRSPLASMPPDKVTGRQLKYKIKRFCSCYNLYCPVLQCRH